VVLVYFCTMQYFISHYFGYIASLCLIIALLVKTQKRFRWANIAGCIFFIVYAIIIGAIPVLLTNSILLAINVFYLFKENAKKEKLETIEFSANEKIYLKYLDFYKEDIIKYFPNFDVEMLHHNLNFVVIRDTVIATIFSAKINTNGEAEVCLNYATKQFRDSKNEQFILEKGKQLLQEKGVHRIVYAPPISKAHETFIKKMGFLQSEGKWFKNL
jgi:hypothetical protein